jgi:hypothetical protein
VALGIVLVAGAVAILPLLLAYIIIKIEGFEFWDD